MIILGCRFIAVSALEIAGRKQIATLNGAANSRNCDAGTVGIFTVYDQGCSARRAIFARFLHNFAAVHATWMFRHLSCPAFLGVSFPTFDYALLALRMGARQS